MQNSPQHDICRRIAALRLEIAGPRGKSSFAKKLSLSPSTYDYYESSRVPPADVLVQIADLAGVDLRWLLTGTAGEPQISAAHPAVQRAAALLARHADAAAPLAAFLDLLAETFAFPAKKDIAPSAADKASRLEARSGKGGSDLGRSDWIPILGRSAAGVPQFWSDEDEQVGLTSLEQLVARHSRRASRPVKDAVVAGDDTAEAAVQIIQLSEPTGDDVVQFVAAGAIKTRWPDAFAVQIDGESMMPDIAHGDMVILSPSAPAADGRAAVVQLRRQIGVTCKLYRRAGDVVHLVPVSEQFPPQSVPAEQIVWALRVLARVRALHRRGTD